MKKQKRETKNQAKPEAKQFYPDRNQRYGG